MCNNTDNTCQIWDKEIDSPGVLGDCEHLRNELNDGYFMKSGDLVWMTDKYHHESVILNEDTYRQFFRIVCSEVDLWYEMHNTKILLESTQEKMLE